jgi:hydantoinase/carbamoylase family amidase
MKACFEALAQIGHTPAGICRLALSREDLEARAWFADRIEEAGFLVQDDDVGNLSGILRSSNPEARTLLIGSHLDTVPNAGSYDGAVGIVAALECLRTIHEAKLDLPLHLEVIDFTDDEGTWFPMFGSRGLCGLLRPDQPRNLHGETGAFHAALIRAGINPSHIQNARRSPEDIAGYLELHIEQGWRLERAGIEIGIVTGMVGRTSCKVSFYGHAGHSGTANMHDRQDALQGASLFVIRAHEMVREYYPQGVLNCGNLVVQPGAQSVIPSEAHVMVELRHENAEWLEDMEKDLRVLAEECAYQSRVGVSWARTGHIPAAIMDDRMVEIIESACSAVNVSHQRLCSYASHNAQVMSAFTPSAMVFIPSINGISHNPAEYSTWEDVENGANVLLHAIIRSCFSL